MHSVALRLFDVDGTIYLRHASRTHNPSAPRHTSMKAGITVSHRHIPTSTRAHRTHRIYLLFLSVHAALNLCKEADPCQHSSECEYLKEEDSYECHCRSGYAGNTCEYLLNIMSRISEDSEINAGYEEDVGMYCAHVLSCVCISCLSDQC